jgi:hypothetical protein
MHAGTDAEHQDAADHQRKVGRTEQGLEVDLDPEDLVPGPVGLVKTEKVESPSPFDFTKDPP